MKTYETKQEHTLNRWQTRQRKKGSDKTRKRETIQKSLGQTGKEQDKTRASKKTYKRDIEQGKPPQILDSFVGTPVVRRYNSVTGTEGDLKWAADSTLRQNKHIADVGRQFVVYDGNQAYPKYLIRVRRKVPGGCKPWLALECGDCHLCHSISI